MIKNLLNFNELAIFIKLIVSLREFKPVPIKCLSLYLLIESLFIKSIFSEIDINCDCPVLPNIAVPWQPWSINISACSIVLSTFRLRSELRTDIVAA